MNRKELNKTFMMISNRNKPFNLKGFYLKKSRFKGLRVKLPYCIYALHAKNIE